jgi:hypothetical protein
MPKTGILVFCGGALLLPLARAMNEGGLFSFSAEEKKRYRLPSESFLIAAIFFSAAAFMSACSEDCTLAVFFWLLGLLLLVCIGNELSWARIGRALSRVNFEAVLADKHFLQRISVYGAALLVSMLLNFYSLTSIPYNIHGDEGEIAERAAAIPIFAEFFRPQPLWWHLPSPDLLLQRIGFLAGDGLWAIRAGSAFYGVIANLLMLSFLRRMFSSWLAAASWILIITAPNLLQSYRQGLDIAVPVILASLFVGLVMRLFSKPSNLCPVMILIGTVLGLSMVVYVSARGLLVGWGIISVLLVLCSSSGRVAWRNFRELAFSWVVALLVMSPMVSYYVTHPQVPKVREQYGFEFKEDFVNSTKTASWFTMVDDRVAGSIATLFTQKERIGGDFFFYFAGLLPISVVVLTLVSLSSPSPRYRASVLLLVAAVFGFVLSLGVPLRNYDRFHRVALVFPFFAILTATGLDAIAERFAGSYLRRKPGVLISVCILISFYQVVTYFQTHGDSYEWEFVSPKTRAARTLQSVLNDSPQSKVYCVTEPWFDCSNGTFRILIPGIASRAVNLTREAFNATKIPWDSGGIVILSIGFEPLKEPEFADRLPFGTKKKGWLLPAFKMGTSLSLGEKWEDVFSGWRVPAVMPSRVPDINVTTISLP